MSNQETQETIDRWATHIIPVVFRAEDALKIKHPEWLKRLQNVTAENMKETADEYCRAIATEIVTNGKESANE